MDNMFLGRKTYSKTIGGAISLPHAGVISIPNPFQLPGSTTLTPVYFGNKKYELSDWLGNVRVVINDKKTPVNSGTTTISYIPQVTSVTDYYSFGSEIFERTYSHNEYRFGFNGKEDLHEQRWYQDYGARFYHKALGRFVSADPLIVKQKQYAWLSSYQFAGNKPIMAIDLDGLEPKEVVKSSPLVQKVVTIVLSADAVKGIISGYYREKEPYPGAVHGSIDIQVTTGTPVKSVAEGQIFYAGWINGYGNTVVIKHEGGLFSLYAHLSKIEVNEGEKIEQSKKIGMSGSTGKSKGPHLHFEFIYNPEAKRLGDLLPSNDKEKKMSQKVNLLEKEKFDKWFKDVQGGKEPKGLTKEEGVIIEQVINKKEK